MQNLMPKLRHAINGLRVRIAILAVIAAVIGWQLLPAWLKLAIVQYAGLPIAGAIAMAVAVAWINFSWSAFMKTAGITLAVLLVANAIAVDGSEGRCTGYVVYWAHKISAEESRLISWLHDDNDPESLSHLEERVANDKAERAAERWCYTLKEWRAAR